jgi:hypothetical protein
VPFRYFRHAALFRAYLLFSVAALALYGFRDLSAMLRRSAAAPLARRALVLFTPWTMLALGLYAVLLTSHPDLRGWTAAHALFVWISPLAMLLIVMTRRLPVRARTTVLIGSLLAIQTIDGVWSARLAGPLVSGVNDGWYRASAIRYDGLDLTRRGLARTVDAPDNFNLWHKIPAVRSYTAFSSAWYDRLARSPVFERAVSQSDRIFFVAEAPLVAVHEHVFSAMLDRAAVLGKPVLALQKPDDLIKGSTEAATGDTIAGDAARIATLPAAEPIAVHVDRYTPDELAFSTTAPAGGWLLVTDRWARGWKATVNGTPATVYVGDFVFRAVRVPAGAVQVRFAYEKSHGPWLVALSWSVCGILLIVMPLSRVYLSRRHHAGETEAAGRRT